MLINNVNLIPMTVEQVIPNQSVWIEGTTIVRIGSSDQEQIPDQKTLIDGRGAYLMPGLADMHMHTRQDWLEEFPRVSPFYLYLANGVTTIRDFWPIGDDPTYVLHWRDEINKGMRDGPVIYCAGTPLFGPVAKPKEMIRQQKTQGFDFVKLYSFLSRNEFHEAMAVSKQLGIYTAGHIPFAVGLNGVLSEGMDEIAHLEELDFEFIEFDRSRQMVEDAWFAYIMEKAFIQYEIYRGVDLSKLKARIEAALPTVIEKLKATQVPVCTTMVVGQTLVQKLFAPDSFLARPENRYLVPAYLDAFRKGEEKHQRQFKGHENLAIFKSEMEKILLTELHRAGITLLLSTDAGSGTMGIVPGFSLHQELQILIENGFTAYEALATGTINAANTIRKMTGTGDFGTIEVGKRADLILVKENPLDDVAHLKNLLGIVASGKWHSAKTLEQKIRIED